MKDFSNGIQVATSDVILFRLTAQKRLKILSMRLKEKLRKTFIYNIIPVIWITTDFMGRIEITKVVPL